MVWYCELILMMQNENQSIVAYMRDIHSYSLVTPRKEQELAKLIKKGNQQAKEKLITANLRLVVKIAHEYNRVGR